MEIETRKFKEEDVDYIQIKILKQIEKIKENYLEPKFILLSKESYPVFSYLLYKLMSKFSSNTMPVFVNKCSFVGVELDIVIIDEEGVELPKNFVKVVPAASDRFLKES